MKFHENLMFPALKVADRDELLETLGQAVVENGLAREDYAEALKKREASFPTGLPISGGVAIPHTSAEHVLGDTIAVAALADTVEFGEMGGDGSSTVPVSAVFLLAFSDGKKHLSLLSTLVQRLQNPEFVQSVRDASEPADIVGLLDDVFPES